jgi:hypothetical protein
MCVPSCVFLLQPRSYQMLSTSSTSSSMATTNRLPHAQPPVSPKVTVHHKTSSVSTNVASRRIWSNGAVRMLSHRASSNVETTVALRKRIAELERLVAELSRPSEPSIPPSGGSGPRTPKHISVPQAKTVSQKSPTAAHQQTLPVEHRKVVVSETLQPCAHLQHEHQNHHREASTQTEHDHEWRIPSNQALKLNDWFSPRRVAVEPVECDIRPRTLAAGGGAISLSSSSSLDGVSNGAAVVDTGSGRWDPADVLQAHASNGPTKRAEESRALRRSPELSGDVQDPWSVLVLPST